MRITLSRREKLEKAHNSSRDFVIKVISSQECPTNHPIMNVEYVYEMTFAVIYAPLPRKTGEVNEYVVEI